MAEVVQSHVEDMLPEIYELKQHGVLSAAEAKSVIRTRTDFEYKMRRRISMKSDFLRFIEYELKLEKIKQARILKFGINDVSEGVRYKSLQRIHFIFQKCLRKYKNDVPLWIRYIKFCKQANSSRSLGLAFVEALKHNPGSVELWIMSAKNEMEGNKNVSAARAIFLQGLKFNKSSIKLWTEYFRLEVLHVEKLKKRQMILSACDKQSSELSCDFLSFKTAKIVFLNALSNIQLDSKVLQDFVDVLQNVEGKEDLIQFLFETAMKNNPGNPSLWIMLAFYVLSTDKDKACNILFTGIKIFPSLEFLTEVIQFVISHKTYFDDVQAFISKLLLDNVNVKVSGPESVIKLGTILEGVSVLGVFSNIMDTALRQYPTCKALWLYKVQNLSEEPIEDLKSALDVMPTDTDIWHMYLQLLAMNDIGSCKEKWHDIMKNGFAEPLLSSYIEFIYSTEGLAKAREAFENMKNWHSVSEEAMKLMLEYECAEPYNVTAVCKMYDALLCQFNSLENWTSYITFCKHNCPQATAAVMWKCKNHFTEAEISSMGIDNAL